MPFDFQPTMKGMLVELRPLRRDDADDLFAVASDSRIWEQHPIRDRYKPDVFSAFFRESLASRRALTALDCKDGKIIGSSQFHAYNAQESEVEIGWTFLARSHWGDRAIRRRSCRLKTRHRRTRLLRVRNHVRARLIDAFGECGDADAFKSMPCVTCGTVTPSTVSVQATPLMT
jgi:hypothetical protein